LFRLGLGRKKSHRIGFGKGKIIRILAFAFTLFKGYGMEIFSEVCLFVAAVN
jgi:hypothetical protein